MKGIEDLAWLIREGEKRPHLGAVPDSLYRARDSVVAFLSAPLPYVCGQCGGTINAKAAEAVGVCPFCLSGVLGFRKHADGSVSR